MTYHRAPELTSPSEWRPVPGYERLYEVSSDGRVRSLARTVNLGYAYRGLKRIPMTELRQFVRDGSGYVALPSNEDAVPGAPRWANQKKTSVRRMVHEAFVGPIPSGFIVREVEGLSDTLAGRLIAIPRRLHCELNSPLEKRRDAAEKELDRMISERS